MLYDIVIIGGGVVGCAIARELSRFRLKIALTEAYCEVGFGTTKTNSGIIHSGHHSPPESLKGKLVVRGNRLYDDLQRDLKFGFKRIGELDIAQNEEDLQILAQLKEKGEKKGVTGLELWDRKRLLREEPNLSAHLLGALYAPAAGVINPYELSFGLAESAAVNGVSFFRENPVYAIDLHDGVFVAKGSRLDIHGRFIINAAGVFADKIAEMVGLNDFQIQPRKGEEYMLDKRLKGVVNHLIFPTPQPKSKGILIIPTFDGTIMVGPTAEDVADRYDFSTTLAGARTVFSQVKKYCPSISERDVITEFAGLRAVANTNDFIIGPTRVKGFINVAGIQSPGLTAAPAIAEYVREILWDEGLTAEERSDWQPAIDGPPRFALMTGEQRRLWVSDNPQRAKIVCRCELVTEAEVLDAVHHGATTLDGVKFRVRAGMGRCQGGFCTSRVMEILAREQGVPLHRISKRGKGSEMFYPRPEDEEPSHDNKGETQ